MYQIAKIQKVFTHGSLFKAFDELLENKTMLSISSLQSYLNDDKVNEKFKEDSLRMLEFARLCEKHDVVFSQVFLSILCKSGNKFFDLFLVDEETIKNSSKESKEIPSHFPGRLGRFFYSEISQFGDQ